MFHPTSQPVWTKGYQVREHIVYKRSEIESPLVSVIVPVFNMESRGYLDDLLSSLEKQTLSEIELILVDDCSTDASLDVLIRFADRVNNATIIHSLSNGRQGAARNLGLEYASGEYIGFVDGDDAVDPSFYEELYRAAVAKNADMAVGAFILTVEGLGPVGMARWQIPMSLSGRLTKEKKTQLLIHPAHIWCSLYKTRLFSDCGLRFPEGVYFEDNPTCFRLYCQASSCAVLDEASSTPRYYYRQSSGSTDHMVDILNKIINFRISTSNMLFEDALECGIYSEYPEAVNTYYLQTALINTLKKISCSPTNREQLIRYTACSVAERIRPKALNTCRCSTKKRLQIKLAYYMPRAFVFLSDLGV